MTRQYKQGAQGIDIGCRADLVRLAGGLLRRHETGGAQDLAGHASGD